MTLQNSFERWCRLCAEEQEVTVMIFSEEAEAMLLQKKLNRYLLIEVAEDDNLPKNICVRCCAKLQSVCEFIDNAHKAQEVLINQCLNSSQKQDTTADYKIQIQDIKSELCEAIEDDDRSTEMEVSVDPMMVLQNSEETLSPNVHGNCLMEDVTYLHGVDGENVTIKLIKRELKPLEQEDKTDEKPKPFPCLICKRGFHSDLALKNHTWTHIGDKNAENQYKCNTCSTNFNYKCDLIKHLKEHKSNGLCQLCGRMFRSERTYAAHMSIHLSSKKTFTCKVCGRSYNTWGSLKTHSVSHSNERPYQCPYCKKCFKRNQDLKFHINQHTGAKPYKCPFCDKCFASSGNCYSHRSRMHPGRRANDKVRRWNGATENNQRTTLTPVKGIFKYQCQQCGHSFMKKDHYTYHMYQHTGEKPFQCSYCSEKFVTRRGLLIHHDKEHPHKNRPLALLSKNILLK